MTALGAAIAGGLVWVAGAYVNHTTTSGYWWTLGIVMGGGLALVLFALLVGRPRGAGSPFSPGTFLLAFVPALIVVGWIAAGLEPHGSAARDHVLNWSGDVGIRDVVRDFAGYVKALAFGLGCLLGFSLAGRTAVPAGAAPGDAYDDAADEPVTAEGRLAEDERTRVG
jgi:hypothetical protein